MTMRRDVVYLALWALALGCEEAGEKRGDPAAGPCGGGGAEGLPAFTLKGLDGKDVSLASFRGKGVLLNFWAVDCGFCRQEIPALKKIQDRYGPKGFTVVAVNFW